MKKKYDSTIARIAGNLLSGKALYIESSDGRINHFSEAYEQAVTAAAVRRARFIVAEVERTEPEEPSGSPRTP